MLLFIIKGLRTKLHLPFVLHPALTASKQSKSSTLDLLSFRLPWEDVNLGFKVFLMSLPLAPNPSCLFLPSVYWELMISQISFDTFASWLFT